MPKTNVLVVHGKEFKGVRCFAEHLGVSLSTVYYHMKLGKTLEEIEEYITKGTILVEVDGYYIRNYRELADFLCMKHTNICAFVKKAGSFQEWWQGVLANKLKVDNINIYSSGQLHKYLESKGYTFDKGSIKFPWGKLKKFDKQEDKLYNLKKDIDMRLKIAKWFCKNNTDFTYSDVAKRFGADPRTLLRAVAVADYKSDCLKLLKARL